MLPDMEVAAGQVPKTGGALSDYEDFAAGDDNSDESAREQIWGRCTHRGAVFPLMTANVDVRPRRAFVRS